MRILVAGGSGFLGSHLCYGFVEAGHDVWSLSSQAPLANTPNLHWFPGRVTPEGMSDLDIRQFDVVVDAASSAVPAVMEQRGVSLYLLELEKSLLLAELAAANKVPVHVYLSSGGTVYGPGSAPHSEDEALSPTSRYGALKASAELSIAGLLGAGQTKSLRVRISNAFGPRQNPERPQGIIPVGWWQALQQRRVQVFGGGRAVRDYIYAADVAKAVEFLVTSGAHGPVNVGSGNELSVLEVINVMRSVSGLDIDVEFMSWDRQFDVDVATLDCERIRTMGWAPECSFEDGLLWTWKWIEDHWRTCQTN